MCLVTNRSYLVAMFLGKRPHDLSGSTQCLRIPCFLCLHPTNYFPHPIHCSKSLPSWWDCVYLPVNPTYPEWSVIVFAFKILPLPLWIMMGLSYTQSSPYKLFPQYLAENTKQKYHFKRGVFFFLLECKLLESRDNVFCMFYCA